MSPQPSSKAGRRLTLEERREALRLYNAGQTINQVSEQLGRNWYRTASVLRSELSKIGQELAHAEMKAESWTTEMEIRLVQLREEQGLGFKHIAIAMGLSVIVVQSKYGRVKAALGEDVYQKWPQEKASRLMKFRDEDGL